MKNLPIRTAACAVVLLVTAACQDGIVSGRDSGSPGPHGSTPAMQKGYILRDGTPVEVTFEVRGGLAIIEGDIDIGPATEIARTRAELLARQGPTGEGVRFGVVNDSASRYWTNGIVGYEIENNVTYPQRVLDAIAHIEARVHGIDLQPRTNHSNYIIFRRSTADGCSSPVGRMGGGQVVYLNDSCSTGQVVHEIGHSLGMQHEHSRCDRDTYITIHWNNIESGQEDNFQKHCTGHEDIGSYDLGSIMHYRYNDYGKPGGMLGLPLTTISANNSAAVPGQRDSLSIMDRYTIDVMYPPFAPANFAASYPSGVPALSWSASAGVTSYTLYLTEWFEEYIPDYGGSYNSWHSMTALTTTTATTATDSGHAYTGQGACTTGDGSGGWVSTRYTYDLVANYPSGVTSKVASQDALIAVC